MAFDLFFVSFRAGRTCPSIATCRLGYEGRLNTSHVKEFLAPIAPHGLRAGGVEEIGISSGNKVFV